MEYISKRWMIDLDIGPSPPLRETSMQFLTLLPIWTLYFLAEKAISSG